MSVFTDQRGVAHTAASKFRFHLWWHLARALLGERTRLKPGNAWTWQRYAQALEAVGDDGAARGAAGQACTLLAA